MLAKPATDAVNAQGAALEDLAEVLAAAGRSDEAAAALGESIERYERKRNVAAIARVRARLASLEATPTEAPQA